MARKDLDASGLPWRKARRSAGNGACVEVAPVSGKIFIRDSKDQQGPVVQYPGISWRAFLADAKNGRFDLDRL
jgi:Domain of unknown function (DUF397)